MKKYFKRMWWANKLYDLFPERFCWADLALWGMGSGSFFQIFKIARKPKGCILNSMDKMLKDGESETCYCGAWYNGHHGGCWQGKKIQKKLREEWEKEQELVRQPF